MSASKLTRWERTPHFLRFSTGGKSDETWFFADENHIAIWTANGCLGRIYPAQLRKFLEIKKVKGRL